MGLFHFVFLFFGYFVFGVIGQCQETCIPIYSGQRIGCKHLQALNLPYEEYLPGSCGFKNSDIKGRNALCCKNQQSYAMHTLKKFSKSDEDDIARIAVGALEGEFPHQVYLTMRKPGGFVGNCGGTIYNKNHVITAMHCITNLTTGVYDHADNITVTAGVTNLKHRTKKNDYQVDEVIPNTNFNHLSLREGYDIAILRLKKELNFQDPKIGSLKIAPPDFNIDYRSKVVFVGWGNRNYSGVIRTTPDLHKTFVPLRTRNQCSEINAEAGTHYTPSEQHICIGGGESGITVGQGDSGGPAICPDVNDDNKPVLCGIASFKLVNDSNQPTSQYLLVSPFAEWIETMTNRDGQDPISFPDVNLDGVKREPEDYLVRVLGRKKHCDGTLVSNTVVITSASCLFDHNKDMEVFVTHTKTKKDLDVRFLEPFSYSNKSGSDTSDKLLKDSIRENDLLIIHLRTPVNIDFYPKIPNSNYIPQDAEAVEISFSSLRDQRELRNYTILDQDTCQKSYDILTVGLKDTQLCGIEKYSGGSHCDKPLGSPLICDGTYLCGVASTRGCIFAFPNIYTNVKRYAPAINESIKKCTVNRKKNAAVCGP